MIPQSQRGEEEKEKERAASPQLAARALQRLLSHSHKEPRTGEKNNNKQTVKSLSGVQNLSFKCHITRKHVLVNVFFI